MIPEFEDRHITIVEALQWLTAIGCTEIIKHNDCVISGIMKDGHRFTTDIREHSIVDIQNELENS